MLGRADTGTPSSDDVASRAIGHPLPRPGRLRNLHGEDTATLTNGGGDHERQRALRREVGPTAWAVLADLCLDVRADDAGVLVVATSARRVAVNVGVGKDTAARALRRLVGAGVLCRRPQGSDAGGRFAHSTYELHLGDAAPWSPRPSEPDTVGSPCTGPSDTETAQPAPVSASSGTGTTKRSPPRDGRGLAHQLSLLDAGVDARKPSLEKT